MVSVPVSLLFGLANRLCHDNGINDNELLARIQQPPVGSVEVRGSMHGVFYMKTLITQYRFARSVYMLGNALAPGLFPIDGSREGRPAIAGRDIVPAIDGRHAWAEAGWNGNVSLAASTALDACGVECYPSKEPLPKNLTLRVHVGKNLAEYSILFYVNWAEASLHGKVT